LAKGDKMTDLFQAAAKVLTGRAVTVHFRQPSIDGGIGCAFLDENGQPTIEIKPDLPAGELLNTFLHELAHVKLGHLKKRWSRAELAQLPDYSQETIPLLAKRETEVAWQLKKWQAYLERQISGGSIEEKLQALTYYPVDMKKFIDQGVEQAFKSLGLVR